MGNRDHVFDALVLRRWAIGDAHRGVAFLTREMGPLTAIAHGAAQSRGRLKLLTTPLRRVRLKAYHDPVSDAWKVVDLEALDLYGGLAEDLDRSATASVWAEILWRTQAAGQPCEVYDLFAEGYRLLNEAKGDVLRSLHAQVLWRSLELTGVSPDFTWCAECGKPLTGLVVTMVAPGGEPVCPRCAGTRGPGLSSTAIGLLLATSILPLDESLTAPFDPRDLESLVSEGLGAWERNLGSPLKATRVFSGARA